MDELVETIWVEWKSEKPSARHSTLWGILRRFDNQKHFREVFQTGITGSFEAQCHANQFAEVTEEDLQFAEGLMPPVDQMTKCNAEERELLRAELREIIERRRRAGSVEAPSDV